MRDAYSRRPPLFYLIEKMDNLDNDKSSMYGSIIGAAGQFATGLINNAISQRNADDQRDWEYQMWSLQNSYNDPGNMAARMRSAGLNPFTMTGAQPAGSVGTGAMAQTFPIENPLNALKTIAEVENLNATTGRTESETEMLYKKMAALDLAYSRGLIEKEDYERHVRAYWDAYSEKSEYEFKRDLYGENIKNTSADTAVKESQKNLNESQSSLTKSTESALLEKLPHEIESFDASAALARAEASTQSYLREYYTASSDNQRSSAVKNYAESRLIDVKTDIESAFGALQAEANLNKTQLESRVIIPLADSLIALQQSAAMLNKDNIRHNKVEEDIRKEAVRIQRALLELKKNEFYYSMFKDAIDKMIPDADSVIKAIGNIF